MSNIALVSGQGQEYHVGSDQYLIDQFSVLTRAWWSHKSDVLAHAFKQGLHVVVGFFGPPDDGHQQQREEQQATDKGNRQDQQRNKGGHKHTATTKKDSNRTHSFQVIVHEEKLDQKAHTQP